MQQQQKAKLGARFTCFQCGTKFYSLNRPEPTCPECGANQEEAPEKDIRTLLASTKGKRKAAAAAAAPEEEDTEVAGDDDSGDDDDELFDELDDEDGSDDYDDDED